NELPADAAGPVAAIPGDPMPQAGDPAELLDIDVEQLAGPRVLVAASGPRRGELAPPGEPPAAQAAAPPCPAPPARGAPPPRPTGARLGPTAGATRAPVRRWRRRGSTWATTAAGVACGDRWGRQERSRSPARPSCSTRRHHFRAVRSEIPKAWATAATGCRHSRIRLTNSARLQGVVRAFWWMSIRAPLPGLMVVVQ